MGFIFADVAFMSFFYGFASGFRMVILSLLYGIYGCCVVFVWLLYSASLVSVWLLCGNTAFFGVYMVPTWVLYVPIRFLCGLACFIWISNGFIWFACAVCMALIWFLYGLDMAVVWHLSGLHVFCKFFPMVGVWSICVFAMVSVWILYCYPYAFLRGFFYVAIA